MTDPVFAVAELPSIGPAVLDGPEGHHAARVRRLRAGESLVLADGVGGQATATVTATERDRLQLEVTATERQAAPAPRLVVVQALAKGDRGELAVELMTELGVDEIVPWRAARCVARWDGTEKTTKALTRWRATALSAAKQARRSWFPVIAEPHSTAEVANRLRQANSALVLHESATGPLPAELPRTGDIVLVVGPEGGIAPEELAAFAAVGAVVTRLGREVLRTSTAGAAALAAASYVAGRWSDRVSVG